MNRLAALLVVAGLLFGLASCQTGPRVTAATPAAGAAAVLVDATFVLTFDQAMAVATIEQALRFEPQLAAGHTLSASADGKVVTAKPNLPLAPGTAYRVSLGTAATSAAGKALRQEWTSTFNTAAGRAAGCVKPSFSPDGRQLAWTEGEPHATTWQACLASADGSTAVRRIAAVWPTSEVVWSADGKYLLVSVVAGGAESPYPALARVEVAAVGGTAPPQPSVLALNEELSSPSRFVAQYSPDGSRLAVQNDMYMADAHSDVARQLGIAAADGSGWRSFGNLLLGWSANSRELFYLDLPGIGGSHAFDYDVYRYTVASGVSTQITALGTIRNFGSADRSPDGRQYAFHTWQAEEVSTPEGLSIVRLPRDLWLLDAGMTGLTRLTINQGHNADVRFGRSGELYFASDRVAATGWDIWVMPDVAQPGTVRNVTARPGYDAETCVSPAGDRIAFISDASGSREVWTISTAGAGWRMISGR